MPRWLWAGAVAVLIAIAIWAFRAPVPTVDDYRDELTELAAPETPSATGDPKPIAIGARALLDATAVDPIRADLVRRAARWFDNAALTTPDETGQAVFYAGLAWRLGGREDLAQQSFKKVPENSPYARAARAAMR